MTVQQLIAKLSLMPPSASVVVPGPDHSYLDVRHATEREAEATLHAGDRKLSEFYQDVAAPESQIACVVVLT